MQSEVKARLIEAAQTLKHLPGTRSKPGGYQSAWPEVVLNFWDAYDLESPPDRPSCPSPAAIKRMDEVLNWIYWIKQPRHRQVVWARSLGVKPGGLARRMGVHRETIRAWYKAGVRDIAERLAE